MDFLNWMMNNWFFMLVLLVGCFFWLIWDICALESIPRWMRIRADTLCRAGQKITTFGAVGLLLDSFVRATAWQLPFVATIMLTFVLTSLALKLHRTLL